MDWLGKFFEKFPDFFKSIVETVINNGPVGLAVLLLCVLLACLFPFREAIVRNRYMQTGVVCVALTFGGLLLYLLYQAVQAYIAPRNVEAMVVIKGTVRYPLLSAEGGDLYFEFVGPNTRRVGDSEDRFYSYDKSVTEKRILVIAKPERIELTISNRPVYRACTEDSARLGSRGKNNQTVYVINLPDAAYRPPQHSAQGAIIYYLDFEYLARQSPNRDLLRISGFGGIDHTKLTFETKHFPDNCLDEDIAAKYVEVMPPTASLPTEVPVRHVVELLGEALVASSRAQGKSKAPDKNVLDLLGTTDPGLAGKARGAVSQAPTDYLSAIADLLHSTDPKDATSQANALIALKGAPSTFKLPPAAISQVVRLTYVPSAELRQAARNYLTDSAATDDSVVQAASEYYQKEKLNLKRRDPQAFLLLTLAMREIYYVAGVNKIVDYVGNWGDRERKPEAINASLKYFDEGIALIGDVPEASVVPYAKPLYGKTLALRSRATVNAAIAELGPKASSKEIDRQIYNLVTKDAPLPFGEDEKAQFDSTIDTFLKLTNGRENEYIWPTHITKMKACRERHTYTCLRD
jgi:hypothetical protein